MHPDTIASLRRLFFAAAITALAACGPDGGDEEEDTDEPPPPAGAPAPAPGGSAPPPSATPAPPAAAPAPPAATPAPPAATPAPPAPAPEPPAPEPAPPSAPFTTQAMVAAGSGFSVALKSDGTVHAWGDQQLGSLGNGSTSASSQRTPQAVAGLDRIKQVAAGEYHAVALRDDGTVWTWGPNAEGQLGLGTIGGIFATPQRVPGVANAVAVAAGLRHTVVLLADGRVLAWGENARGELGLGDTATRAAAAPVPGIAQARHIGAGGYSSAAVLADGTVLTWGVNADGQLGVGDKLQRTQPTVVAPLQGRSVVQISIGRYHTLVRAADGSAWSMGANVHGQAGPSAWSVNGTEDTLTPIAFAGPGEVASVAAGHEHSLVLLGDGRVFSWGRNTTAQLGNGTDGTSTSTAQPQYVERTANVTSIAAGSNHTLALVNGGMVLCAGSNFLAQCGRGDVGDSTSLAVEVGPGFDAEP